MVQTDIFFENDIITYSASNIHTRHTDKVAKKILA